MQVSTTMPLREDAHAPSPLKRHTYPAIDVLRGMAALLVVVFHVIHVSKWTAFPAWGPGLLFYFGWVGVNIFLVISGFVITLSALTGFARDGTGFRTRFAVHRLVRILPLYLLTSAVYLAIAQPGWLHDIRTAAIQIGSHLAFVHNLHPDTHGSINGPTWTIGLEMQFYVLVLCATPWLARAWGLKSLVMAFAVAALFRYAVTLWLVPGQAAVSLLFIYTTQLPGVIEHFALGMTLALALWKAPRLLARRLAPTWSNWTVWTAMAVLLFALVMQLLWSQEHVYWSRTKMIVALPTLLALGCAALLGSAISYPAPQHRALQPLRYLGRVSYGLYLWHMPVLLLVMAQVPQLQGSALLVVVVLCTLLLSAASWHLVELPLIQYFRRPPCSPGLLHST